MWGKGGGFCSQVTFRLQRPVSVPQMKRRAFEAQEWIFRCNPPLSPPHHLISSQALLPCFLCLISFPSLLFHHPSSLHISPLSLISASPYRLGLSRLLACPQNCTTPNLTNPRERSNSPSALLSCPLVLGLLPKQKRVLDMSRVMPLILPGLPKRTPPP